MATEQQLLVPEQENSEQGPITHDELFEMLLNEEDITWQTMIYELVRTEKMDPWDVDVSLLSKRLIDLIKKLKKLDFRTTGKMVLAAAILLKIKSNRLVSEDISAFDQLLHSSDQQDEYLELADSDSDELVKLDLKQVREMLPTLVPRMPQPRKRKVSIFDIVKALEQALEVQTRRHVRQLTLDQTARPLPRVEHKEISLLIQDVYGKIIKTCGEKRKTILFEELMGDTSKETKIYTFIPVLHLSNEQRIDINQEMHFGPIEIELLKQKTAKIEKIEQ